MAHNAAEIFALAPVIPVITINDPETAVPLARALVAGGIPVLEVTLRTKYGLEAIRRIRAEVEGAVVGVGTVLNTADLVCALKAGCEFVVTPGFTPSLLDAGAGCGVPFIPGIATVSEMMTCLERGLTELKFFPAEASGGPATLKAFAGPVPQVSFCPTGGVGLGNLANYLAVPAVKTVGGSWICPDGLISKGDWDGITRLAAEARDLVTSIRNGN